MRKILRYLENKNYIKNYLVKILCIENKIRNIPHIEIESKLV